ncbi:endonuclease III [Methyloceanibacter sp.]|uniref:endonuclease III domain-containing protein n=1 Tax=Methyloceanibacter sp. TaxID=1965321 RepID=UPI002C11C315|nr:endonuclease III [Methyloceanibacter sp.]HML91619.1 endonuclease III [Methyloceanibacter sp.]
MAARAKAGDRPERRKPRKVPGTKLTRAQIDEMFARFEAHDPDPKTELDYDDPFTLLVAEHGGKVPRCREDLEALPGVGRKTANVVLNVAFGEPTIAIDTHIFRVSNRTGLAPGKTPLMVEETLDRVIPERYKHNAHHWLILHGRYVCKARKPECWRCGIRDLCAFDSKTGAPA